MNPEDNFWYAFDHQQPKIAASPAGENQVVHYIKNPEADKTRYALKALQNEADKVRNAVNGTRNHELNRAVFSLAQLVAGGALNEDTVREALEKAAEEVGLEPAEIQATINSGFRGGLNHPRGIPERDSTSLPTLTVLQGGEPAHELTPEEIDEKFPTLNWDEVWAHDHHEEWIVEPLLPARRLIAIYSAPKVGKSLLLLEIAVAIARGSNALGATVDRPRRVLYVDFENDPYGDVRERLQDMHIQPEDLTNLIYLSFPTLAHLDSEKGSQELLAIAKRHNIEVIVIDTISRAVGGEENANDTWLAFYRHTGLKIKQAGMTLIRLDHSGKSLEAGMRGGSAKYGDVDAVWKMFAITDDTFKLECEAQRFPIKEKILVIHRKTDPLRHVVDATPMRGIVDAKLKQIVANMDLIGVPIQASKREALEMLREAGFGAKDSSVLEALNERKIASGLTPFGGSQNVGTTPDF